MMRIKQKNNGFISVLELVVMVALLMVFVVLMAKAYFRPSVNWNKETRQAVSQAGITVTNYSTLPAATKDRLDEITAQRSRELERLDKEMSQ